MADYFLKKAFAVLYEKGGWEQAFEVIEKRWDFYFEIRRDSKILNLARDLANRNSKEKIFNEEQRQNLVERIKRHARVLQDNASEKGIRKTIFHFDTLKLLDPEQFSSTLFIRERYCFLNKSI